MCQTHVKINQQVFIFMTWYIFDINLFISPPRKGPIIYLYINSSLLLLMVNISLDISIGLSDVSQVTPSIDNAALTWEATLVICTVEI